MQFHQPQAGKYLAITIASLLIPAIAFNTPGNSAHADESHAEHHDNQSHAHSNTSGQAQIKDVEGVLVGTATFRDTEAGLEVAIAAQNLAPGAHAIHIHEIGKCEAPNFKTAGGHFDPNATHTHADSHKHVDHDQNMHSNSAIDDHDHGAAGDLPNLIIDDNGTGKLTAVLPNLNLGDGFNSLFHPDGTTVIIHAGAAGVTTMPGIDADTRIACGVIMPQ
jgi:Cu-Zn family superoxide dismutase